MINKRRAIPLIVVIFLVCIVLALGLYHVFTSFDIKRSEDIVGAINVTTTGSSENIPLATSNNGDFSGIFFQEAEYNKLIILKKNWMTGRYSCWGTASTLSTVGTYPQCPFSSCAGTSTTQNLPVDTQYNSPEISV